MIKLLFLTAACLLPILVTAQSKLDIDKINEGIKDIPYIFEGYVIDTKPYYGDENGAYFPPDSITNNKNGWGYMHVNGSKVYPYFSVQMQVCTIYKGTNLQHGTIEIVVPVPPKSHVQPEWAEFGDKKLYFSGSSSSSHQKYDSTFLPWLKSHWIISGQPSNKTGTFLREWNNKVKIDVNTLYTISFGYPNNELPIYTIGVSPDFYYTFKSQEEFSQFFRKLKTIKHNAENKCKDFMKLAPQRKKEECY